jgi:multiple sugar transport system ATP-binding protein
VAEVVLKDVDKIYEGNVHAVQSLSLDIADGEFLVLVGPSGCGKTTALRMVAGLETISGGTVTIGDRVVNQLSPKDRDIAMVFQSYALYPHLTVADNIAFGLRLRKMPKEEVDRRIAWAAKLLDLTPYLARKPKELSGGQRQRVAMGRAIVREPQVFLMDEPLSNLDAKLRVQMRAEVAKLQHDLGITTIYVTHDQVEAMTMGDRVAVMSMGKLQQVDTPQHLYDEPFNMFVASFIGTPPMNLVEATVAVEGDRVDVSIGPTTIAAGPSALARYPQVKNANGRKIVLGIRAEDLHPAADRPAFPTFNARIDLVEALGSGLMAYFTIDATAVRTQAHVDVEAETGPSGNGDGESVVSAARPNLIAHFPPRVALRIGDSVPVAVDPDNIHFFDLETGAAYR